MGNPLNPTPLEDCISECIGYIQGEATLAGVSFNILLAAINDAALQRRINDAAQMAFNLAKPIKMPRQRGSKKRLTPAEWVEIERLWESGTVTYANLMDTYGLAQSSFERHFKKKGIVKGSKLRSPQAQEVKPAQSSTPDDPAAQINAFLGITGGSK